MASPRLARTAASVVALGAAAVAVAVAAPAVTRAGGDPGDGGAASSPPAETAAVERRDLVVTEALAGTLGFGPARPLVAPRGGVLTAHPRPGAVVDRGQALYEVDGTGVELFLGARPLWRPLAAGVADGPDVRQLEENLVALGFATPEEVEVDERFTAATAGAVRRWQRERGRPATGVVEPADVAVQPGPVRIHAFDVPLGAMVAAGMAVGSVTATAEQVTATVSRRQLEAVGPGQAVTVELPDGRQMPGRVESLAPAPAGNGQDEPAGPLPFVVTMSVDVPGDRPDGEVLDQAPVRVHVERQRASGVLTVPVAALLARAGGRFVVERAPTRAPVEVELGIVAGGLAEVRGELREGDRVVVAPA